MLPSYKMFNSAEFTNRDSEFKNVDTTLKEKDKGVLIFEENAAAAKPLSYSNFTGACTKKENYALS